MRKSLLLALGAGVGYWLYHRNKGMEIGRTGRYVPAVPASAMDRAVATTRDYGIGAPGEGAPDAAASDL